MAKNGIGLMMWTLMATPNTAQKSNAGLSLRAEQFNHLKSANKCFAFSLSLSGTASALGTLCAIIMKTIILSFLFCIFAYLGKVKACECESEQLAKHDSIFKVENIYNNYPIIFYGEYQGWDYYKLRIFKVLKNYKGLSNKVEYFTLRDNSCNFIKDIGDKYFISAYFDTAESTFMTFDNCNGSFILSNNLEKNQINYFDKMLMLNGPKTINIDNRNLSSRDQILLNSICYDYNLRNDKGEIKCNFLNRNTNLIKLIEILLGVVVILSLLINIILFRKLRHITHRSTQCRPDSKGSTN